MKDAIIVFTSTQDRSVDDVIVNLEKRGEKIVRFDTDVFPEKNSVSVHLNVDKLECLLIDESGKTCKIEDIKSCWYRGVRSPLFSGINLHPGHLRFIEEETRCALWGLYTSVEAFWMNPPILGSRLIGNNKLYQMKIAHKLGFRIPDSMISNSPEELAEFANSHGGVAAVKMMSGHVFVLENTKDMWGIYTQMVEAKSFTTNAKNIKLSPILAQEYIAKKIELRVTIVGDSIFACAIHSQDSERTKHDWRRYDFSNVKHEVFNMPKEVESKLLTLMKEFGLSFGAVDMILTPENDFVFLEVNPQGQWGWIEELTGMPISNAIAENLAGTVR
mgnify:CR=1 FL=1